MSVNDCVEIAICRSKTDPNDIVVDARATFARRSDGKPVTFRRTIKIKPLVEAIVSKLRDYHEANGEEISGLLGSLYKKAAGAARRIASSDAVRSIARAVQKYGPDALEYIPYGGPIVKTARKVHDRINEARAGSQEALAKLAKVAEMAKRGVPEAQDALAIARSLNEAIKRKQSLLDRAPRAIELLDAARDGDDDAADKIGKLDRLARSGDGTAKDLIGLLDQIRAKLDEEDVSGWTYNRPYRSPIQSVMDSSPGIGMMARHLYHKGI